MDRIHRGEKGMTSWHHPLTKNKYGAKRTTNDGRSFASKLESNVYSMLKLMERGGLIKNIRCQQTVELTPRVKYKSDFTVFDIKLDQDVWVEAKGFEGERWRVIRNLWLDLGPGLLRVYKQKGNRIYLHEELRGQK